MPVTGTPLYETKAELLRALAHPVRIRVLELLVEQDRAVHELRERIEVGQAGLSQHLAVLRRNGIVRQHRIGGQVVYSVIGAEVGDLLTSARHLLRALVTENQGLGQALDEAGDAP